MSGMIDSEKVKQLCVETWEAAKVANNLDAMVASIAQLVKAVEVERRLPITPPAAPDSKTSVDPAVSGAGR